MHIRDLFARATWQSEGTVRFDQVSPVASARKAIVLFNPGPMPAVLGLTSVVGPDASRFKVESGCAQGSVIQAGTGCELTLVYSPGLLPLAQAVMQIRSDQGNPASLALQGVATTAAPPATVPVEQMLMVLLAAIATRTRSRSKR